MSAGPLIIGPAADGDAQALIELRRAILAEGAWFTAEPGEVPDDARLRADRMREARRSGNQVHLVARIGTELVGACAVEGGRLRRVRHVGRLEIMVARAWRGRGVGAALLQAALASARLHPSLEKVELAVYAHNARALTLYERHGFVQEGRRVRQQRLTDGSYVDEVWMARWLRPERA